MGTKYGVLIAVACIGIGLFIGSGILMHYCSLPVAKVCKPRRRVLLKVWVAVRSLLVKAKIAWSFYQVSSLSLSLYPLYTPTPTPNSLILPLSLMLPREPLPSSSPEPRPDQVATLIPEVYAVTMPAQVDAFLEVHDGCLSWRVAPTKMICAIS